MSQALAVKETGLPEKDFNEVLKKIEDFKNRTLGDIRIFAEQFARMSRVQFEQCRRLLKGFLRADHCSLLRLMGRGEVPDYLVLPKIRIKPTLFLTCEPSVRENLRNPEKTVEVATERGVKVKSLSELNELEMAQVVDPKKGFRSAKDQYKWFQKRAERVAEEENDDAFELEKIVPDTDPKHPNCVIVVGKDKDNFGMAKIRVALKDLRKFV